MRTTYHPWKLALAADATDANFPSDVPTRTEPSGNGVINLALGSGGSVASRVRVKVVGTGAYDATLDMRVLAYSRLTDTSKTYQNLFIPDELIQVAAVLSTLVGIAASPLAETYRFADTITITNEPTFTADVTRSGSTRLYSPASNRPAWFEIETGGAEKLKFVFDLGTATAANALYMLLD
jgi:hypothetical protein